MTLKLAIEKAIHEAAPDVAEVMADGAAAEPETPQLLQIEVARPSGAWAVAGGLPDLEPGTPLVKDVAGERLMFIRQEGTLYAYRPACPACAGSLADGTLERFDLTCNTCGSRYDILRAGRCLDSPELHLDPVPLLVDDAGLVRVALAAPV
jgi:nitrite reductase/ring-hydroxylating ferredoxin subunit